MEPPTDSEGATMRVTIEEGRVRLDLAPDHEGPRVSPAAGSTAYLGKFGVITEWDGRGTLLGLSVPVGEGGPLELGPELAAELSAELAALGT